MPKPKRIQLRRTKGWRMPPNTVKVDRSGKWGNPFPAAEYGVANSLRYFREVVAGGAWMRGVSYPRIEEIKAELRGKNLACWCKPDQPCHADILLELANK